jgi:hypothetical protein
MHVARTVYFGMFPLFFPLLSIFISLFSYFLYYSMTTSQTLMMDGLDISSYRLPTTQQAESAIVIV